MTKEFEDRGTTYSIHENVNIGEVKVADEVVAIIAGLAATEVEGVESLGGNITNEIVSKLGMKNLSKGVKVEVGTEECAVDLNIIVRYGAKIPEVCENIYQEVKKGIETMTGLRVVEVNIHVQGVQIEKKAETPAEPVSEPTPRVR